MRISDWSSDVCSSDLGGDECHGSGGEWRVEAQRLSWEILDAFRAAAAEYGIPPTKDFNRGNNEGCGYFQVNQRRGLRWSSAKAFLRPAMKRPNLTVLTEAQDEALALGRASCRARVGHTGSISVVALPLKKKKNN